MLVRALASDPLTPSRCVGALASAWPHDPVAAAHLAAHPNLRDDQVPHLWHSTRAATPHEAHDASVGLAAALDGDAATAHTRARVLARTGTRVLLAYLNAWDAPHPDTNGELATRPPTGNHDDDLQVAVQLALHPHTPTARRITALRDALRTPLDQFLPAVEHTAMNADDLQGALVTSALRHAEQLRDLATHAADPDTRAELTRHAALHADGHDVLQLHLAAAAQPDPTAPAARNFWATAVARTGDPHIAERALDDDPRGRAARTIAYHPALRGTPVWWRARAQDATRIPAGGAVASTRADSLTFAARYGSFSAVTCVAPHDVDASRILSAAWSRLHYDHDLTQPTNPRDLERTDADVLAYFALHPAMPDEYRRTALEAFPRADPITFALASTAHRVTALTRLVAHAGTLDDLHTALLNTPMADLRAVLHNSSTIDALLTWHLSRALRRHHQDLSTEAVRTLAALEATFTGTVQELLTSSVAVTH